MKVVILAGGQQSTLADHFEGIPKPMAEIGGKPILWHMMKLFSHYGYNDFIICGGYKVNMIKDYFVDYYVYQSDITVDLASNTIEIHKKMTEDWQVTVVDTGLYATTGQRIDRIRKYIQGEQFLVVYGDCLWNIDVADIVKAHEDSGKILTMAVARPAGRNSAVVMEKDGRICQKDNAMETNNQLWVNAGILVLNRRAFDYLKGNYEIDQQLIPELSAIGEAFAYRHSGFYRAIETRRDKNDLENLWNAGMAPWKVWE